jgi:hypothetical protein
MWFDSPDMAQHESRDLESFRDQTINEVTGKVGSGADFVILASYFHELESLVFDSLPNPAHQGDSLELGEQRRTFRILDWYWKAVRLVLNLDYAKEIAVSVVRELCLVPITDNRFQIVAHQVMLLQFLTFALAAKVLVNGVPVNVKYYFTFPIWRQIRHYRLVARDTGENFAKVRWQPNGLDCFKREARSS